MRQIICMPLNKYYFTGRFIGLFVALTLMTGCSLFGGNKRPAYQNAEYYKNLQVPPNLTQPDKTDAVQVPEPAPQVLKRFHDNNNLATVILPVFKGVHVVNAAGDSWLEVNASVEKIWPELLKFWQQEGVEMAQVRPLLGFMETKWIARKSRNAGFIKAFFQRFEPDQKDKFRLRVERFDNGSKTRIFITHSGIERVVQGEFADDYIWISLPSDIEREREIVARLGLFAGLNDEQRMQLADAYKPYASLVTLDPNNSIALTMKGSLEFVHRRALRALDRLRVQNLKLEGANIIHFTMGEITKADLNIDEDELSKTSWLMQLFTSDKSANKANKNHQFKLLFSDQKGSVRIEVRDENYAVNTDENGDVSSSALAEQFRNLLADKLE